MWLKTLVGGNKNTLEEVLRNVKTHSNSYPKLIETKRNATYIPETPSNLGKILLMALYIPKTLIQVELG